MYAIHNTKFFHHSAAVMFLKTMAVALLSAVSNSRLFPDGRPFSELC